MTTAIANIGENLTLRRAAGLSVESGVVGRYVHTQISDGLGKIAVIVALESKGDKEVLATLARQLAMHVASANPLAMTAAELDAATVEREKNLLGREKRRQAAACAGEDHRIRPQDLLQGGACCPSRSPITPTTRARPSRRR